MAAALTGNRDAELGACDRRRKTRLPCLGQEKNGGQPNGGVREPACHAPFEVVIHDDGFWTRANR